MSTYTKQELSASNAASFPDNTTGFITPELLRNFNTSSIDSYAALSGSNTFVGNQIITGSVVATSFTGSLLGSAASASYALSASYAVNSTSASYASSSTSASYALTANFALTSTSASYASSSTSASYALVAQSALSISSGSVVYTGLTGYMDNLVSKTTGSFNMISGSYTKILSISSSTSMVINMNTFFAVVGASPDEIGFQQYAGYLRPGSTSNIVLMPQGNASSQTLINPQFSASFNSGTGYVDVFGRNAYGGLTSSVIISMDIASANPITIA